MGCSSCTIPDTRAIIPSCRAISVPLVGRRPTARGVPRPMAPCCSQSRRGDEKPPSSFQPCLLTSAPPQLARPTTAAQAWPRPPNYILTITQLVMTHAILHRPDVFFPSPNNGLGTMLGRRRPPAGGDLIWAREGDSDMSWGLTIRAVTGAQPGLHLLKSRADIFITTSSGLRSIDFLVVDGGAQPDPPSQGPLHDLAECYRRGIWTYADGAHEMCG